MYVSYRKSSRHILAAPYQCLRLSESFGDGRRWGFFPPPIRWHRAQKEAIAEKSDAMTIDVVAFVFALDFVLLFVWKDDTHSTFAYARRLPWACVTCARKSPPTPELLLSQWNTDTGRTWEEHTPAERTQPVSGGLTTLSPPCARFRQHKSHNKTNVRATVRVYLNAPQTPRTQELFCHLGGRQWLTVLGKVGRGSKRKTPPEKTIGEGRGKHSDKGEGRTHAKTQTIEGRLQCFRNGSVQRSGLYGTVATLARWIM